MKTFAFKLRRVKFPVANVFRSKFRITKSILGSKGKRTEKKKISSEGLIFKIG